MWLVIVAILLIAAIWVGGYFLALSLVLEIACTAAVVLLVVGAFAFRRWRAVSAARALEREILKQAEMQAATARPDRRAEVLALQEQIKKGLAALKQSKLAAASGGGALYALPWYMIVGPPGAGKTTALRHSGLVFPFLDPTRGGLKGVGGTRNCDWWFTNEAVILDTAGRYATEEDDRDEWMAFLDMLKKYRSKAPINGMIVAISMADIVGSSEDQVEQIAKTLRARVDEMIARLQMVVPVYVMFTKADLVAGFVEFWEDLRKSERAQIWGASFPIEGDDKRDPARAFEAEFGELVERLHAKAIDRMRTTRRVDARAKVLQFPLEFAAARQSLSLFVGTLFQKNMYQETPLFRGAYFTSGTQEGRPLDRVMGEMARAFGVGLATDAAAPPAAEPKSYFLTDLFQKVMFPDQHVAVRTAVEARRRLLMQVAIGGSAALLAAVIALPSILGFTRNRELVAKATSTASQAVLIDGIDRKTMSERIAQATALRETLDQLDRWDESGAPWGYRYGMYTGGTLRPAVRENYAAVMETSFVRPVKQLLEERLANYASGGAGEITPELYGRYYDTLKTYLMLTEQEHLDVAWATPGLAKMWNELLRTEPQDRQATEALVRKYLELQKRTEVAPAPRNEATAGQARGQLRNAPRLLGDYAVLLADARTGLAPITRGTVFGGTSADAFVLSKTGVQVDGVYTRFGWLKVRKLLEGLADKLKAEVWVLGEGAFDPTKAVASVRALYFEQYSLAWERFIGDLYVNRPKNVDDALPQLLALTEPEWPYLRLIRTVNDNVAVEVTAAEAGQASSMLDDAKALADKGKALLSGDAGALAAPKFASPMERTFKSFVAFGIPAAPGKPDEPPPPTGLGQYIGNLRKLVAALTDHKQKGAAARGDIKALETEFQGAYQATVAQIADQDTHTRDLLQSLLVDPITLTWSSVLNDAGGASGAFWEMSVYKACDASIHRKFPFDPTASKDATIQDFTEFFRPKEGVVWAFYEQNLKSVIEKKGDQYIPTQRFGQRNPYSGAFLDFLKRSDELSNVFFPGDGKAAQITFDVNLHSVSPEVSEVTFEIDGVSHTYKNTPEEWMTVSWPAKDAKVRGAKIRVRGFGGLGEEIPRLGDFGIFRLLAEGNLKPGTAGGRPGDARTLVATWAIKSQRATVQMDVRPSRSEHAFDKKLFSNYRCPRIITNDSAR